MCFHDPRRCILPPDLLHRMARDADDEVRALALDTLALDHRFRMARAEAASRGVAGAQPQITFARLGGFPQRTIYDQQHRESQTPGVAMRAEGQPAAEDTAVNQAYDGLGATYAYY